MKEREYIESLYETYNKLLTQREKEYFEQYYFEDNNMQEIADNNNVSKAYVGKYLNNIEKKLRKYEEALKMLDKLNRIRTVIEETENLELISKIESII